MPTAIQIYGINLKCSWCKQNLTKRQIQKGRRCCSNACKLAMHHAKGNSCFDAMPEPQTDAAVAECDRLVAEGKVRLRLQLDTLLLKQTPADDSPEAERRLRESLAGYGTDQEDE